MSCDAEIIGRPNWQARRCCSGEEHQHVRLDLCLNGQREMHRHLVTVEVGVEALADQRVNLDGVALDKHRLKSLNAHAMQRRGTVQKAQGAGRWTSSRMSQISGSRRSSIFLVLLIVSARPCPLSLRMMKG